MVSKQTIMNSNLIYTLLIQLFGFYSYLKILKKLYKKKKKPILFVLRCQLSKLIVWIDIVNETRSIGWKTCNIS